MLVLFAAVLTGCNIASGHHDPVPEPNQAAPKTFSKSSGAMPVLFIVGDSTVHNAAPGLVGWGDVVSNFFDGTKIQVENWAKPGRSTRTFISQGWWGQILAHSKPGDFVVIQMGHNDSSPINDTNRSRGTLPGIGTETTNLINGLTHQPETVQTYGGYLRKYISDAREKNLTPILCTPVSRLPQPGKELDTTRYSAWAREVAVAEKVPLIDLNQRALEKWARKSVPEIRTNYFATTDTTHFNRTGAELNAACVVDGIRALDDCALKSFLISKP